VQGKMELVGMYKIFLMAGLLSATFSQKQDAQLQTSDQRVKAMAPSTAQLGSSVDLVCKFNLAGLCKKCYSVFWTRSGTSIYVYNPFIGERKSDGVSGVELDKAAIDSSDFPHMISTLKLKNATQATSGTYCCRIVGGAQWEDTDCASVTVN